MITEHKKTRIRFAESKDCETLLEIYAPFVRESTVTFETEVPSVSEYCQRIQKIMPVYPWIVLEIDGQIVGYAYAGRQRERAAYNWNAELSVYVHPKHQKSGVGKALYTALLELLKEQGYYNAYACITYPGEQSIGFHKKMEFSEIGIFYHTGFKFGKWLNVIWMEKSLQSVKDHPPLKTKTVSELPQEIITNIFTQNADSVN